MEGGTWTLLQRLGLAFLAAAAITFTVAGLADASAPTNGGEVSGAIVTEGTVAHAPYSSGQMVNIDVPANSVFNSHTNVNLVECSAPGGVIPTDPTQCDGNTIQGNSIKPATDESVSYKNYQLFSLPDSTSLAEGTSGPACNATTECILYIGDDQTDFTQPHVWSTPFYIVPNAGDAGTNPGDGSAPSVTTTDPTTSTVAATPEAAAADSKDPVMVTVTLIGTNGNPVPGDTVTLSQGSGHSMIAAASPSTTNSVGQATFSTTDATPETVVYTAKDTTAGVTLTQTASVDFEIPAADRTNSSVVATPTTVPAAQTTTITVTLRDQARDPQPVTGQSVLLSGTGSAAISPTVPVSTDSAGQATFTASDSVAESVTFKAIDVSEGNLVLTQTATVVFGSLTVSPSSSTLTAGTPASVTPPGVGTSAVVTLLTPSGSPVAGKEVTLKASSTTATVSGPATTNSNGQASFTVTDSAVETVTLSAVDTTDDNLAITAKATVDFETSAPSGPKSVIGAGTTMAPADGQTQVLITVTINDQFGQPLEGKTVTLQAQQSNPSGNVQDHPFGIGSTQPGETDSSGVAEFEALDTTAESVKFTATDTTDDNLAVSGSVTVTFSATAPDPDASIVAAVPTQVANDGTTASTVTVTLTDFFGNPITGKTISLTPVNGNSVIKAVNPTTDANGDATFSVTDTTAEVVTYNVTDTSDKDPTTGNDLILTEQAIVTFGNPPAPPPVAADCSVTVMPSTVPADGATTATISVLLYDGNGYAVPGKVVTLNPSGGSSKVTAVNGTTDNTGSASFTVSDSTAETVTYTVEDTTDSVTLSDEPVTVTFAPTAGSSTGSTTTTTSSTTSTSSTSTSTTAPSGSGSTSTTSTTQPADASSSASSTTTTTGASTTSNSVAVETQAASDSSGSGASGSSPDNSAAVSLAFTGVSRLLHWLIGCGVLLVVIGTLGRRRFNVGSA